MYEVVNGSIMADNNGPAAPREAGPLPVQSGYGVAATGAAPCPDEQATPGFTPTSEYKAALL